MRYFKFESKTKHPTIQQLINQGAKKILIIYRWGLGDVLMFLPFFQYFKKTNPACQIDLELPQAFASIYLTSNKPREYYDYVIQLVAHFNQEISQFNKFTKVQCNCKYDLGIPYNTDIQYMHAIKQHDKRLVGMGFHGSYGISGIDCPQDLAKRLWEYTQQKGFLCVELFVPKDKKAGRLYSSSPSFVDWSFRTKGLGLQRMLSFMSGLAGCAAASTGTFHVAMCLYPERTLYLKNKYGKQFYMKGKGVLQLDVNKPDFGIVDEWIAKMKAVQ